MTSPLQKPSIPSVNSGTISPTVEATRFQDAVKGNLDIITGRANGVAELQALTNNATNAQIIGAINAIIARLNGSGTAGR